MAQLTLKYTQSNPICLARDGPVIGNGAGQQSGIHCTRIACHKADLWYLRHHPTVLARCWPSDRVERYNAIDEYLRALPADVKSDWLLSLTG